MTKSVKIPGGTMTWLMEDAIYPGIGVSMAEMTVDPGETSELHSHDNCAEIIYIMEGQVEQRIGKNWKKLEAGDKCVIPINHAHQTRNMGMETVKMLIVYTAGHRGYQKLD